MTATLQTFTIHWPTLGGKPLEVDGKDSQGNVTIHLGNGHKIVGNRPEDFQTIKDAAEKALSFFEPKA